MLRHRTEKEIDELVALARTYCEVRADHQYARAEGRVSAAEEARTNEYLKSLDEKLALLKSDNELVRSRAYAPNNIIQLCQRRKAAR